MKTVNTNYITIKGELERRSLLAIRRLMELKEQGLVWSTHARYGADFPGRWLDAMSSLKGLGLVVDDLHIIQIGEELLKHQCPEGCYAPSADYFRSSFQKSKKDSDTGMDTVAPGSYTVGFSECRGYMGLLALYKITGDSRYLDSVRRAADFALETIDISRFPDRSVAEADQNIRLWLVAITGGFVELSLTTGDTKYLKLAEELAAFLPPIDPEVGFQHAHGYMTALRGILKLYEMTGNESLFKFVKEQWQTVVDNHMWITGGIPETFPDSFGSDETCQCTDWIRWNLQMWRITREVKYMEMAELALFNHLFFAQWLNGGFEYGSQLERGVRWFEMLFCCSMHGARLLADVAQNIITYNDETISVNFFFDSEAKIPFPNGQVGIDLKTLFPKNGTVSIVLHLLKSMSFELAIRIPTGCENPKLFINGQSADGTIEEGYLHCQRQWKNGDAIKLDFHMPIRFVPCKNKKETNLIYRGPIIMALRRQVEPSVYQQVEESLSSSFVYDSMKTIKSLAINGMEYNNCLTTRHGYCQIMFNVPDGADWVEGKCYISPDATVTKAKGQFHVYIDGQEQFCSGLLTDKDPVGEFKVSLEGAKTVLLAADSSDFYQPLNFVWIQVQLHPGNKPLAKMDLVDTVSLPIDTSSLKEKDIPLPLSFVEPIDANWNIQLDAEVAFSSQNKIPVVLVPMAQVCYDEIPDECICDQGFYRHASQYNNQLSQYRLFFSQHK